MGALLCALFLGGVSEGALPFMFIAPSDTNFFIMSYAKPINITLPSQKPIEEDLSVRDQWYWDAIEKYKNDKEAYAYLSQNPFLAVNNRFSASMGQSLAAAFGDTSARDDYYNQLRQKATDYLSQWEKGMYEQKYNSPVEQVKREAAAGINPDLSPGSISPGSAAENDQPGGQTVGNPGAGENPLNIVQFGSTILNTALSCVTGFQQVKSIISDNALKSVTLNETYRNSAWNLIKSGVGEFVEGNSQFANDLKTGSVTPQFVASVSKYFQDRLDRLPYSRGERRKLRAFTDSLIKGVDEAGLHSFTNAFKKLVADSLASVSNSRADAVQAAGRPGASAELPVAMRFVADEIYKPLNDLQLKVNKLILKGQESYQNSFQSTDPVSGLTGPQATGAADRSASVMRTQLADVKNRVLNAFEEINKKITGSRKLSDGWKIGLSAGVAAAESMLMTTLVNGLPSIKVDNSTRNFLLPPKE